MQHFFIKRFCSVAILILALSFATGCGKKSFPIPDSSIGQFTWNGAKAEISTQLENNTPVRYISILADIKGDADSIKQFVLELEPQTQGVCAECPFLPSEVVEVEPVNVIHASNGTRYSFLYRLQNQDVSYRWRLVAHNVNPSKPHTFTKVYKPVR